MPLESANEIDVSPADLATMIGVSRHTLNVLLSRLERRGLVKIKCRRIQVMASYRDNGYGLYMELPPPGGTVEVFGPP